MPDLRHRSQEPELMDGEAVTQDDFAACLADLARVNTLTLARRPTLRFVTDAMRHLPGDAVPTIVDVGFGAGDMLRAVRARLNREGRRARLVGIDLNPRSAPVARAMTDPAASIEWVTGDAFAWIAEHGADLIVSSLVAHHMSDEDIVRFLRCMEANARLGWLVNDLHRSAVSWHGFSLLTRLTRWHRFVKHDGPLSIARSFRREDWDRLLREAGCAQANIAWWFPYRFCVEARRW